MRPYHLAFALLLAGCAASLAPPSASPPPVTPSGQAPVRPASSASPAIVSKVADFEDLPYYPMNFAFGSNGATWIYCQGTVFKVMPGGEPQQQFFSGSGFLGSLFVTQGDQLWLTVSASGVQKLSPKGEMLQLFEGRSSDWASQPFTVDRDGHVWVGYDFGGKLHRYAADGTKLQDLDVGAIRGLRNDSKGNVVAGGIGVVTWLSPAGETLRQAKLGENVSSFALDSKDEVWAVEQDERGTIYHLRADGTVDTFHMAATQLTNLMVSRDDSVWATGRQTLYRMDPAGRLLGMYDLGEGFSRIDMDPAGFVWAGYQRKKGEGVYVGAAIKFAIK